MSYVTEPFVFLKDTRDPASIDLDDIFAMLNRNIHARRICLSNRNDVIENIISNIFRQILTNIFNAIWRHYELRPNPINIINIIKKLINCNNIISVIVEALIKLLSKI